MDDLFDEILMPSAAGGRKTALPLTLEVERSLTVDDIEALSEAPAPSAGQKLLSIRHSHHQLARLIAEGTENAEISLLTGYAPAYISMIKGDPTFKELLAYYEGQRDEKFIDVVDRMRSLGLSTLDELQRRLAEEPEKWSNREVMDLARLTIGDKGAGSAPAGGAPQSGPQVNITFVSPPPSAMPLVEDGSGSPRVINGEAERVA